MKRFVIIVLLSGFVIVSFCQKPSPPEMISVSIRPLSDTVTIDWKPSPTVGIDGYKIYEYVNSGSSGFNYLYVRSESPSAIKSIFSYPKVRTQSVVFYVASYFKDPPNADITSNPGPIPYHRSIFTKLQYDSCGSQAIINWNNYFGWDKNFGHYKIFQIKDGINLQVVADNIGVNDTTYNVPIEANRNYCLYVCAVNKLDGTITSFSNDTCIYTKTASPPTYINADNASFAQNSSNPVEVRFSVDVNSPLKKYQLYTSGNPDNGFFASGSVITAVSNSITVQDNLANNAPKYYKLSVLNNCNKTIDTSNLATAVILRGSTQSSNVNLAWNDYKGWSSGVQQYSIYRVIGNNPAQSLGTTFTPEFADNINALIGQKLSGTICYYIEATSNPDMFGNTNISRSSNYCIDLSSSIFVPNAFTPNGDGLNDEFKPSFAFLPKDYVMVIYNRYGFKVFETSDSLKGWDGIVGNGQRAPDGAYIYFIKFASQSGSSIEKRGNFSLVYP